MDDDASSPSPAPLPPLGRPHRALALGLAGGVAVVMALAAALVVVGTPKSAEATVVDSVQHTLADRTADVALTLHADAAGQQVTGTGSGQIDFTRNAAQLHLDVGTAGQQVRIDEIVLGRVVYIGGLERGSIATLYPGRSWISIDAGALPPTSGAGPDTFGNDTNPAAMLRLVAQPGNTVTALGPSTVAGTSVQGYSITFDPAKISAELQSPNLPSWLRQATSRIDFGHLAMTVYVDRAGRLRRWTMDAKATAAGTTVDTSETLDFSDYGAAASISAPPADQVLSFDQLLKPSG